ncbi:hypothetical protein UF75_2862 [Desulfosporosinus sp. I2]|nr:hypothetical protein UF75_2862 [Desulfosporosinus sp. I2]
MILDLGFIHLSLILHFYFGGRLSLGYLSEQVLSTKGIL